MNELFKDTMKQLNDLSIYDTRKQNSRDARERHEPAAGTNQAKILTTMRRYGKPMHAKHIAQLSDIDYHEVSRRMSELVRLECIDVFGREKIGKLYYQIYKIKP